MRAQDRGRWGTALAAARRRWLAGEDRVQITRELDELWDEIEGAAPEAAPRHAALEAWKAAYSEPFR